MVMRRDGKTVEYEKRSGQTREWATEMEEEGRVMRIVAMVVVMLGVGVATVVVVAVVVALRGIDNDLVAVSSWCVGEACLQSECEVSACDSLFIDWEKSSSQTAKISRTAN